MSEPIGPNCPAGEAAMKLVEQLAGDTPPLKDYRLLVKRVAALEKLNKDKPTYNFKALEEALWAIGTAVGAVLFQALENPDAITDPKTYAVGVGIAAIRAGIGAALSLRKKQAPHLEAGERRN